MGRRRNRETDENEITEMWHEYRRDQQDRRETRLGPRSEDIEHLTQHGFTVLKLTPYQFRVNGRLDLYPIHQRWHDTKTNRRGSYRTAKHIAVKILQPATEEPAHADHRQR